MASISDDRIRSCKQWMGAQLPAANLTTVPGAPLPAEEYPRGHDPSPMAGQLRCRVGESESFGFPWIEPRSEPGSVSMYSETVDRDVQVAAGTEGFLFPTPPPLVQLQTCGPRHEIELTRPCVSLDDGIQADAGGR